jgi:hypothetical protein
MCNCVPGVMMCDFHQRQSDEALTYLRAKLTGYEIGEGKVTFRRTDGRTVSFDHVDYDSIGPRATNDGVITFNYFGTDDMEHVPFVESWTISY